MKIILNSKRRASGFILLLVLVLCAFSLVILVGAMNRTSTVSLLNMRSTQLATLNNAAEAATEKVFARMAWDFQGYGPGAVSNNWAAGSYNMVPTSTDNAFWSSVQFSDAQGNGGSTYVGYLTNYTGPLPTQYNNQFATVSPVYRITSNATMPNSLYPDVVGTAQEDLLLALVPITTYAIFYNGELEFSDCATMLVNGRVHSNDNIRVGAGQGAWLTFNGQVTDCGIMNAPPRGGINIWGTSPYTDPTQWDTTFNAGYTTNVPSISLSITMTNTHAIIDMPPSGELPMSALGQQRLYNLAHVILTVSNSVVAGNPPTVQFTLQTAYNSAVPGNDGSKIVRTVLNATEGLLDTNPIVSSRMPFLSLTNTFNDGRQHQPNQFITQIDIGQYIEWRRTNTLCAGKFPSGVNPTILYVADRRNIGTTKQAAVRLVNAAKLPYNDGLGFTVASQNPIYTLGNYNTTINGTTFALGLGSTTNGCSVPAAILADALTILSPSWTDAKSTASEPTRNASSMTFNAALVIGNIPSTGTTAYNFSGGVHNVTRFLENWSGDTLTLNPSIVVLFASQIATNQFIMPYSSSQTDGYYNPPTRNWGFDTTYYSPNKQPPGVPCALVPIRFNWQTPPPGSVTSN